MRSGRPAPVLTISRDGCELTEDPERIPLADLGERLRALLAAGAFKGNGIRVHLAPDRCLRRTVSPRRLPISALRRAAELDVETQTPFDLSAVKILVPAEQGGASAYYLVRSSTLIQVQEQLQNAGLEVLELSTGGESGATVRLAIGGTALRAGRRVRPAKTLMAATIVTTAVLLFLSWYQLHSKTTAANSQLDAEIARAEGDARNARRSYDAYVAKTSQLEALKSQSEGSMRATRMWEELSRIIPDASYLTNLTVKDKGIEISGFSKASSELIPIIEGSDLFEAAEFVSPVVKVPGFEGDRFTISFRQSGARQ
nr:PilN domain-containing protein [Sinorhizobium fredii]